MDLELKPWIRRTAFWCQTIDFLVRGEVVETSSEVLRPSSDACHLVAPVPAVLLRCTQSHSALEPRSPREKSQFRKSGKCENLVGERGSSGL